jgi:succinoglycan biosynthesis transport protein ExoP
VELSGYLAVARRWWWTLLVATWVAAVSGYVFASQIPPTYEARAQLLVGPYNTDTETLRAAGALVQTYAELVTTQDRLEQAIAEAGVEDLTASVLGANTRVVANDTTRFLTIRVQHTDREEAADLANALADEIMLLASRGTSRPEGQLQVVESAIAPTAAIAPQVSLIVGLAALAALIGAMVLVMLVEYLSATVRTKEDLTRLTNLPFLGQLDTLRTIPSAASGLVDRVADSAAAAAYRLVAAKLAFRMADQPIRSVVVVGPGPDVNTAQVAANLAAIVARGGRQVILIDGDANSAHVTNIFELVGRPGLSELLGDSSNDSESALYRISRTLRILPRGAAGDADAVDTDQATRILERLADQADIVIVSTGPVHLSAGALVWAQAADSALLVAVRDQSRRDDVTYTIESLRLVGVNVAGAVLADRKRSLGRPIPGLPDRQPPRTTDPWETRPPTTEPTATQSRRTRRPGEAGETGP